MDKDLDLVTQWLISASYGMGENYFLLKVAGGDPQFRELVYCYELYHRWRCQWPNDFPFFLCGEVDKGGHPSIRGRYVANTIPDFLVHIPGVMSEKSNLLVMEVKAATGIRKRMAEDLRKLTAFRTKLVGDHGKPANYYSAYFWVYGINALEWPDLRKKRVNPSFSKRMRP
jgi:hypothetical protein